MRFKPGKFILALLLIAGLVFAIVFALEHYSGAGVKTATSAVTINEVMSSNKGSVPDGTGDYPDWAELYNTSDAAVDISGYGLSDDLIAGAKFVFPAGTKIEAGGFTVVYCSGEQTDAMHAPFKLNSSEELVLYDSTGSVLDSMKLSAVDSGMSLAKSVGGTEFTAMRPSPGFENSEAGISAFEQTLTAGVDTGIVINEFMASNATTYLDAFGEYSDWIELYNTTGADVDISGWGISDSISQPVKATLPEGTVIAANGYLVVVCSGSGEVTDSGEIHVPFSLRAYEEDVVIATPNGQIADSYSYSRQEADASMARVPDGTGEFVPSTQPSPGYPNTAEGYQQYIESMHLSTGDLVISEVMGMNNTVLKADDGEYYDWVELENRGSETISLAGCGLTNNAKNPAKWTFPDISIAPGEHITVYASGNNVSDAEKKNDLHLNFKISSTGESLFLFDAQGKLLDRISAGAMLADISCGRDASGEFAYFTAPTPMASNGTGFKGVTATPVFSVTPGIYDAAVSVEISVSEGESVYYTTDCTVPTSASTPYTGAISIDKNTVIRAVSVRDGYITGSDVSGTYLFSTDGVDHALPVVSLVFEPDDLWNSKTGIYAYGDKYDPSLADESYGKLLESATFYEAKLTGDEAAWERRASFSLFDSTGMQVFNQNIGARIAGSFGRGRAQKGFNIIAREEYGDNRMAYPFFEDLEYTEYKALVLRAGAQDQNRSKIRDELATGLLKGTDVNFLYQDYTPCVLYLNGEYWGVYFMKEKRNRFFVGQHEGIADVDDMNIGVASTRVSYGTNAEWKELMSYVSDHDLSSASAYEHVCSQMDVQSFMDYMICEIYTGNSDYANIQYFKTPESRWKWIYYDFCWGFSNVNHETLSLRRGSVPAASGLFNALLKNSEWRDAFIRRFAEIMQTVYAPERVIKLIDELYATVEPEIAREREKFNSETFMGVKQPAQNLGTYDSFLREIESLKEFAAKRPEKIRQQIQSEFGLSDSYMNEVFG